MKKAKPSCRKVQKKIENLISELVTEAGAFSEQNGLNFYCAFELHGTKTIRTNGKITNTFLINVMKDLLFKLGSINRI